MQGTLLRLRYAPRSVAGFSISEALAVTAIVAILAGFSLPGLGNMLERSRAAHQMMELNGLLQLARHHALNNHVEVTLCGVDALGRCAAIWAGHPTRAFIDTDGDRNPGLGEALIVESQITSGGRIRWRASAGRTYLRIRADGSVKEFGSFTFCPPSGNPKNARQLYLAATGRPRPATDQDGDGIVDGPAAVTSICSSG